MFKIKNEEKLYKEVSHFILFWISMVFTIMLFLQFTNDTTLKVIYGAFAVSIEFLKNYMIKHIKVGHREKKSGVFWKVLLYLVLAFISGICTYGAVKVTLDKQEFQTGILNINTENIQRQIAEIDRDIERLNRSADASVDEKEKMNSLDGAYYSGQTTMTNDFMGVASSKEELLEKRTLLANSLKEESNNIQSSGKDVFSMIGEDFSMSGEKTLFFIFVILIFVLEIALFITSEAFPIRINNIRDEKEMLEKYIDALMEIDGVRLNSDKIISEKTGIAMNECKRYKNMLQDLSWRKKPLIESGRGGSKANFNATTIKKIVFTELYKNE